MCSYCRHRSKIDTKLFTQVVQFTRNEQSAILFTVITQVIVYIYTCCKLRSISMHWGKANSLSHSVQRMKWKRAHNLKLIGLTSFKFVETRRKCSIYWVAWVGSVSILQDTYSFTRIASHWQHSSDVRLFQFERIYKSLGMNTFCHR